jgi:hypothetical protein
VLGTVENKFLIGVRRGHDLGDAVLGSDAAHLLRYLPRARPIIGVGKNVCMNIDHAIIVNSEGDFQPRAPCSLLLVRPITGILESCRATQTIG